MADKIKKPIKIIGYIISGLCLLINIPELINVLSNSNNYPFHVQNFSFATFDFFSWYSYDIYYSKETYILHSVLTVLYSLFVIYAGLKNRQRLFYTMTILATLFLTYPILYTE